jgi:2-oxoglutarate dehydrogenase E1 component
MALLPDDASLSFAEALYFDYLRDPQSVPPDWRRCFEELAAADGGGKPRAGPSFEPPRLFRADRRAGTNGAPAPARRARADGDGAVRGLDLAGLQDRVDQLVRAYRVRGHMIAHTSPLGLPRPQPPELDLAFHGLTEADLDRTFSSQSIPGIADQTTLRGILERLRNTYCRSIGVEYMHIHDLRVRGWLRDRMESTENRLTLGRGEQIRILTRLTDAVIFEEFIQRKYLGAKTFSLEGAESLIPLLDLAIEKAGEQSIEEIVLAMAHRGRLNVLANILGKSPMQIFREFEDVDPELHVGRGDVKYHLGYSNDWTTASGRKVHLSLCFNPSHLEFVNPVALGRVRAKQDRAGDAERARSMALLIHGDAAFAGEGVVQETLNLSELATYRTGGTLHVIVNNGIGFTTPPGEAYSTTYATSVAKMLQIPVFHVNGEDPEAVAQVVRLAMDFRREFRRDVVIDMGCYRRRGHNEGDEPAFTQPLLYRAIAKRKPVREGYLDHLLKLGGMTREEADRIARERQELLERELAAARSEEYKPPGTPLSGVWSLYLDDTETKTVEVPTGVPVDTLGRLLDAQTRLPDGFHPHPKIERWLEARREMARAERPLDWAAGEALAFATLAAEGFRVRLTGQDTARGTFSQRHAILHDVEDGHGYCPLQHLHEDQGTVEIANSPLSEAGVLGFEYGYSLDCPDGLILWEAQFGDFSNAAQVVIDQFITSGEDKWRRLSGLGLLLPHAFEGMGPEHSSARLERFLSLAAENNIQVVYPTTPAQYFHLLRRQIVGRWRKPLVVMTPKSLLRHPRAVSSLADLAAGSFQPVLIDRGAGAEPPAPRKRAAAAERVILCSGKIFYELLEERQKRGREDVPLLRLEQIYPLPLDQLEMALSRYRFGTRVFWVQEEPENMGAWRFLLVKFGERLYGRWPFEVVSRPASASPATGSASSHKLEQEKLLAEAFENG